MTRSLALAILVPAVFALAAISLKHPAHGQVQDAYFEKNYCVDDRGREIRVVDDGGAFPPLAGGRQGSATIRINRRRLGELSFLAQQFLFTRACLEAAYHNFGNSRQDGLECETSRFMVGRFKTRPSEFFEIVAELGRYRETASMARTLNNC